MSIEALAQALPAYAKDINLNITDLAHETVLSEQQLWGCFVACAYAVGSPTAIAALLDGAPLGDQAMTAAKGVAGLMAMNNVFYRTINQIKNREYATLPTHLHMSLMGDPGVDKNDFELWCLAVSALNGCGLCLDAHEEALRKRGVPSEVMLAAIRIAAVVNAASRVLIAEEATKAD